MDVAKIAALSEKFAGHHFTKFLKGKKVVIVGPDTVLKGQGLGPYIDSFDVVVRHNTVFDFLPLSTEIKKDYGSRTDMLYLSPTCIKNYSGKKETIKKLKENKIKYIVYQNGNKDNLYMTGEYCFSNNLLFFKNFAPKVGTKLHYSHHSTLLLTEMMSKINGSPIVPRTGFISVFDMIVHKAKKVDIVGMSFYNGGGHIFRKDVKKELDPLTDHKGGTSPHNSHVELDMMKEFTTTYPQINLYMKDANSSEDGSS